MESGLVMAAIYAGVGLIALLTIGLVFSRLYQRASKEVSFVRTGFGGQRVIVNGGALVFPVLHEVIPVNMNTLRLEVHRANEQALITRDRMRVDVMAEFYVRVKPTEESIADAAQTLGRKTMEPAELKNLVEGKFVDALRSVAAEMTMEELHEKRVDFVQKVQRAVVEDLLKNGLELETVSLTGLDQTSRDFFNPNNAFDAQGLTALTEQIEARRKQRNDIEQDTAVAVQQKNLQAEQQKLELSKLEEYARLEQEREISIRRAAQSAEIAKEQAEKAKEAKRAEIAAKQQVDMTEITAKRAVEEERIDMERQLNEREILKIRSVGMADVEKQKALELAKQDQAIAIAEKSKEQSEAAAQADKARAEAVKAEELVKTAREVEAANRQKLIELTEASKEAEKAALAVTISAEAEKRASEDRAEAMKVAAAADAEAEKIRVAAAKIRYEVEAAGRRALNEAANLLSQEQVNLQIRLEVIKNLAAIIRESVKPMEQIDEIKIFQVAGLGGTGNERGGAVAAQAGVGGEGGSLADQVVSSALRYRAQAPLVDALMKEIGINSADLNAFTSELHPSANAAEVKHVNGDGRTE